MTRSSRRMRSVLPLSPVAAAIRSLGETVDPRALGDLAGLARGRVDHDDRTSTSEGPAPPARPSPATRQGSRVRPRSRRSHPPRRTRRSPRPSRRLRPRAARQVEERRGPGRSISGRGMPPPRSRPGTVSISTQPSSELPVDARVLLPTPSAACSTTRRDPVAGEGDRHRRDRGPPGPAIRPTAGGRIHRPSRSATIAMMPAGPASSQAVAIRRSGHGWMRASPGVTTHTGPSDRSGSLVRITRVSVDQSRPPRCPGGRRVRPPSAARTASRPLVTSWSCSSTTSCSPPGDHRTAFIAHDSSTGSGTARMTVSSAAGDADGAGLHAAATTATATSPGAVHDRGRR